MQMKVVITEKPSVAKDIAKVLKVNNRYDGYFEGNGYYITWAFGHLIKLVDPADYDAKYKRWTMGTLPIIPKQFKKQIIANSGVKKQFKIISNILKKEEITEVICATDAGREGELIFRYIYELANCKKKVKRLWISSQTDKAILEGFSNLKDGEEFIPLYNSAISRSEADWLVGINATRAYTINFSNGQGVMSVGRVQTPVLKMIVDRHREHVNFKPEIYFEIFVDVEHINGKFKAKWFSGNIDRLKKEDEANELLKEIKNIKTGIIKSILKKEKRELPPLLYDLTELQKDANSIFKFSADKTLKLMQSLYEKHKILTYPRTSSRYLSKDIVPKLVGLWKNLSEIDRYKELAQKILDSKPIINKRIVDDSKVTDHHAIIPTDKKANLNQLSEDEFKIFDLVIKRFLAVFFDVCLKNLSEIISQFDEYTFKTTGTIITKLGWKEVYDKLKLASKSKKKKNTEIVLPIVKKNDKVSKKNNKLEKKQTTPPHLYNEAGILAEMETAGKQIDDEELRQAIKNCGLGTPATRAQILERLIKVGYIKRLKNKLIPTDKGYYLMDCIKEAELLSPELTGNWEKKLNDIAQSKFTRKQYMKEIVDFTRKIVDNIKMQDTKEMSNKSLGKCPLCEGHVIENSKAFGCSNWRDTKCGFVIWKTIAGKTISPEIAKLLIEKGKTGKLSGFISKSGKSFETTLVLENGKVVFKF